MRDLVWHVPRRMAEDLDVPLGRVQQAEQQLDGGGLAGAVRAEQAEDLAAPHLEIHVVHRARLGPAPEILEDLGQAANGNDDFAVWSAECVSVAVSSCRFSFGVTGRTRICRTQTTQAVISVSRQLGRQLGLRRGAAGRSGGGRPAAGW